MNTLRIRTASQHYKNGSFRNLSHTPVMAENVSYGRVLKAYFQRPKTVTPPGVLPSIKTDLTTLHSARPVIVWFGHSSYLIHVNGINILVDPVFSGHASPVRTTVKAFAGTDVYKAADMPAIDLLLITHNHYDHLDKKTIAQLSAKVKRCYAPIGVGKYLASYGIHHIPITEMDWWETAKVFEDMVLTATPARHFSGRGLKRGGSLWCSFVLQISGYRIFIGGDSGYDSHFKTIGEKYGPFDIAMLECGQYNLFWPFIHMMPEETVQAAIDLKARVLMPVHWGKFNLAYHPWNEPVARVAVSAKERNVQLTTPKIGEQVIIDSSYPNGEWWNV